MKVFSIILRILSLGACGFAVYCWIDKKDLVAQKEAIIQEHELISGYYTKARSASKETTQDETVRKTNFGKIRERDPNDASLTRLEEIKDGMSGIIKDDQYFGYSGRKVADRSAKKEEVLTFQVHILDMGQKIKTQIDIISKKDEEIKNLNTDLDTQKDLLGKEIVKNEEALETIAERDTTIQDQKNKYDQLQGDYQANIQENQKQMEELRTNLKNKQEELVGQLAAKEKEIATIETEKQDLVLENNRLMSQMRQRMTGGAPSPSGEATPGVGSDLANSPPALTGEGDQPPVFEGFQAFKQHTRVLGFSPKNKMLVLHIGAQQGLKPTMKLRLERNGSALARLGIVKIDHQPGVSFFTVLQSPESEEWQTIAAFQRGDAVTILE